MLESHVVSRELAEKMNWKKETCFVWVRYGDRWQLMGADDVAGFIAASKAHPDLAQAPDEVFPAPLVSEMLEGFNGQPWFMLFRHLNGEWDANRGGETFPRGEALSPADALAKLYIELHKEER